MGDTASTCFTLNSQTDQNSLLYLTKRLENYSTSNNLMAIDTPTREVIERLFVLNQAHIGNRLIMLTKEKREKERDELLLSIGKINLEEFDECMHTLKRKDKPEEQVRELDSKYIIKVSSKYLDRGERCLKTKKFLFVVNLLNHIGPDRSIQVDTDLCSRKSIIQLMLHKFQALKSKFNTDCQVFIICSDDHVEFLKGKIPETMTILPFRPDKPCFNEKGEIILYGNTVQFYENEGDIISFLLSSPTMKNFAQKFDFINFCDMNNFCSPIINSAHLGWFDESTDAKILVSVPRLSPLQLQTENGFIEQSVGFGDILMKTEFIEEMSWKTNLYQKLAGSMKRKQIDGTKGVFYFTRQPKDILHQQFTRVVITPFSATNKIEYSNFCKRLLNIENSDQKDVIEICPSIVHGPSHKLEEIKETLRTKETQISFPIIIIKSN